jgi:tyrosine-protein phosphatase YwqE
VVYLSTLYDEVIKRYLLIYSDYLIISTQTKRLFTFVLSISFFGIVVGIGRKKLNISIMKKTIYLLITTVTLSSTYVSAQSWKDIKKKAKEKTEEVKGTALPGSTELTEEEVGKGLKEALNKGVEKGVTQLHKKDGYFKDPQIKIPMPEEAKKVEEKLRSLGQDKKVDEAIESMNRAAEDAAESAKDIFVAAIKGMTLTDAMSILKGEDDAATKYLNKATYTELTKKFQPIIKASLDKVGATKHWETVFNSYNKIPFVDKVNPDLVEYVTEKALNGLFIQVAKEELKIRKDPAARVTDLLKKVFGS